MNEWQLQDHLSKRFRAEGFRHDGVTYDLVCWELMFPSWGINDNRFRWNEVSVDFIFWSEAMNQILVTELKNHITQPRQMCSAYCQVLHRTTLFTQQYHPEKLQAAHEECMSRSTHERGGIATSIIYNFSNEPKVIPLLMAASVSNACQELFDHFNASGWTALEDVAGRYVKLKEWERVREVGESGHLFHHTPLRFIL
jgi:hypothetical protein